MAFGRGGAGNIEASKQQQQQSSTTTTTTTTTTNDKPTSTSTSANDQETYAGTAHPTLHNQEYAHTGRGGSGNYYSPRELIATGTFEGVGTSHLLGDGTPAPVVSDAKSGGGERVGLGGGGGAIRVGRGGAGNFLVGGGGDERVKLQEDEVKRDVEKGVDDMLSRPEKARLSEKKL
jgi:hypothetical protein